MKKLCYIVRIYISRECKAAGQEPFYEARGPGKTVCNGLFRHYYSEHFSRDGQERAQGDTGVSIINPLIFRQARGPFGFPEEIS